MELKLKMHDVEINIKRDYDDVTISEMFELFETCLIGMTFTHQQITNFYIDKAEEYGE